MIQTTHHKYYQHGAMTLVTSVCLFILSTLIIIFAANFGTMHQKTVTNVGNSVQAFQAAEAGLEFAINYLQQNSTLILANPVNGYIPGYTDSSTSNVMLADNSSFTVVYTNPVAYNYSLIQITSTGTSSDGSSIKTLKQQVQMGSLLSNPGTTTLVSKDIITLRDSARVINLSSDQTITSGTTVRLRDSSSTTTATGGSSPGNMNTDIDANDTTLSNMTTSHFIANYLGSSSTQSIEAKTAYTYTNTSSQNTNYSDTLSGLTGTSVFINHPNGTAIINGNITIGSVTAPVLLVVNGNLRLGGNLIFYGFIINMSTAGNTVITSNANVTGAIATLNNLNVTEDSVITFSSTVLTNLQNLNSMKYYSKVPGSWKDF